VPKESPTKPFPLIECCRSVKVPGTVKIQRAGLIATTGMLLLGVRCTAAQQQASAPSVQQADSATSVAQRDAAWRPYSMLYVFGDSYSDSGSGYVDGNGPTAVVYMAQRLHIPFTYFGDPDSKGKGLNFAVSGARTGTGEGVHYEHGEMLSLGMMNQVDEFETLLKYGAITFDPKQTMFYFAGGLNDRSLPDGATVTNIEAEIENLYALGARRFMVALLPTKIPSFATAGARFNPQLATIPAEMRAKHADIEIRNSNWGMFFDEVMDHPGKYGISDTTNACAGRVLFKQDPTPCASPDAHFFYHSGHPSTAVHKAVGEMLYDEAMKQ
jgi:phospholipase/lecithinase/hemolysin